MLLDVAMPSSEVTLAEHIVVHADSASTFAAGFLGAGVCGPEAAAPADADVQTRVLGL